MWQDRSPVCATGDLVASRVGVEGGENDTYRHVVGYVFPMLRMVRTALVTAHETPQALPTKPAVPG